MLTPLSAPLLFLAGVRRLQPHGPHHPGHLVPLRPQPNHSEVHGEEAALVSLHHNRESLLHGKMPYFNPRKCRCFIIMNNIKTFLVNFPGKWSPVYSSGTLQRQWNKRGQLALLASLSVRNHHEKLQDEAGLHQKPRFTPGDDNQPLVWTFTWLLLPPDPVRWRTLVRLITEASCWLMMQSGFNWQQRSMSSRHCLGSPWLKARSRYDSSGCVMMSHGSGLWVNLLRGSPLDSSTFWTLAVMYCYDWKQISSRCITRGGRFIRPGCRSDLLMISPFHPFCRSAPSSAGLSPSRASSTPAYSPLQRPGRRSR